VKKSGQAATEQASAELAIGLMIALARGIVTGDRAMKEGKWLKKELMGKELRGKIVGIVGAGSVAAAIARAAKAMGMVTISTALEEEPESQADLEVKVLPLEDLLRASDYVVIAPSRLYYTINEQKLKLMKNTAFLINVSADASIDAEALLKALKGGNIAGAATATTRISSKTKMELAKLPNVIFTPTIHL